jgi:RND family efflux transporter MFP subunit
MCKTYTNTSLLLIILLFTAISCGSNSNAKENPDNQFPSSGNIAVSETPVSTTTAAYREFEVLLESNGKIKSLREQLVNSENGGKLVKCNAQTGKFFGAGSPVAQFETTMIQFKLERARLNLFNNTKEYESQLLGYENLLKDKTAEQGEEIKRKLRISSGLSGTEQDIKEANYELSKSVIRAPFSGVLSDVKIQPGQLVKPGEELFRIYDPANLVLETRILESDISLLKKGTPAEIAPLSDPAGKYTASVYEINPYVDENGMVIVKLKVHQTQKAKGSGSLLFPGMNCTVIIRIPVSKSVLVPMEAVVARDGKNIVFTIENGKAKWNDVITGRGNGKEVEIREGLKGGEEVIISNNLQLSHDAPVKKINGQPGRE